MSNCLGLFARRNPHSLSSPGAQGMFSVTGNGYYVVTDNDVKTFFRILKV